MSMISRLGTLIAQKGKTSVYKQIVKAPYGIEAREIITGVKDGKITKQITRDTLYNFSDMPKLDSFCDSTRFKSLTDKLNKFFVRNPYTHGHTTHVENYVNGTQTDILNTLRFSTGFNAPNEKVRTIASRTLDSENNVVRNFAKLDLYEGYGWGPTRTMQWTPMAKVNNGVEEIKQNLWNI